MLWVVARQYGANTSQKSVLTPMTMISNKIVPSNNGDLKACLTENDESDQLGGLPCREMSTAKEVAASTKNIPKSALSAQVRAR